MQVRTYEQAIEDSKSQPGIDCQAAKDGMTKQSFKDECTISKIVEKAEKTGQLPAMIAADPQYGDFSSVPDYQSALNLVLKAEEQFNALSAAVRDRFDNDPSKFLAFMEDSKNVDEAVRMGLATRRSEGAGGASADPGRGSGAAGGQAGGVGAGNPGQAAGSAPAASNSVPSGQGQSRT